MASKSYRKFMATGLSAAVVASVVAPVAGAAAYDDVKEGAWYEEAINYVTEMEYMKGTGKGFEPGSDMTRAQAAQLFANILGLDGKGLKADFSDVKEGAWYYEAIAAVKEHGVMSGSGAKFNPNATLTRGEMAAIIVRAYDLKDHEGRDHSFTDIEDNMFKTEIAILADLGIVDGVSAGKFAPKAEVTRAQMASFIFKTEVPEVEFPAVTAVKAVDTKTVEVTVEGAWTQEDVDALVEAGYELTVEGKASHKVGKVTVKAAQASTSADTTTLVLSEIAPELVAGEALTLAVNGDKVEGSEFKYEAPATPEVKSVSATNAKTLKVELNKELEKLDGLTFTTTRGTTPVVLTAKLSEDKKSIELSSATNLVAGDYTVKVTGGEFVDGKNSATVKVEAQKLASIEILGSDFVLASGAEARTGAVRYTVKDQYGTDITKEPLASSLNWISSVGTAGDNNEGVLTFDKGAGNVYKTGDKLTVTGVSSTGQTVNATLTAVNAAALKTVTFGEIKLPTDQTRVVTNLANAADLAVTAADQYGKAITDAGTLNSATTIIDSDAQASASFVTVDDKAYLRLNTTGMTTAKSVTVTVVINSTGQTVQHTFDVVKPAEAAEVTGVTVPTTTIAAGDAADSVVAPLTVKDQFGTELTLDQIAANRGGITITSSNSAVLQSGDLAIASSGTNKGKLVNTNAVRGAGKTIITVTVNATGKSTSFELEAKTARQLASVELSSDLASYLIAGASTTTKLKYKDQYGADFDATADVANHKIVLAVEKVSGDDNGLAVSPNGDTANESTLDQTGAITLSSVAGKKGSYTFTAKLVNTATTEVVSQAVKTITVAENSSAGLTYSVNEIGSLFKDSVDRGSSRTAIDADEVALGYAKEIKISAKDAAGNSYVIPASEIVSVSVDKSSVATVQAVGSKWYIAGGDTTSGADTLDADNTVKLSVVVNTKEGIQTITQSVVVSKEDLVASEIKILDKAITDSTAKAVTELTYADLADLRAGKAAYAYVIDQFGGIALDFTATTTESVTNKNGLTLAGSDAVVISGNELLLTPGTVGTATTKADATFRYVTYTDNGKTASINVKVTASSNLSTGVTGTLGAITQGSAVVGSQVTETVNFTVNTGASASGNITVAVNGTNHTVAVVAGDTAAQVATKIATQLTTDGVTGYTVTNPSAGVVTFTSSAANTDVADITVTLN